MVAIINSGQFDIIGAARPSISDPFLPQKIDEGRLDDIRECIGCNQCISRWEIGGPPLVCTQNATAGEEYRRGWHPEKFHPGRQPRQGRARDRRRSGRDGVRDGARQARDVGRPPGRGGQARSAAASTGSRSWAIPTARRTCSAAPLAAWASGSGSSTTARSSSTSSRTSRSTRTRGLSAQDVLEYGAEIVIVATGCHFATDGLNAATHAPIEGADTSLDWQLTPDEVVGESKRIGKRVLVLENEGYFMGVSVAQKLAGEGQEVTCVTQMADIAGYMDYTLEAPMLHRDLHRLGVEIRHLHDAREDRARRLPRLQHLGRGAQGAVRGGHGRALHRAHLERRALPRAQGRQGEARGRGDRAGVPDRRRVRAADDRRLDLRRPPPRARDRLAEPGDAAAVHPRAASVGRSRRTTITAPSC